MCEMDKNINKPITIARAEFISKLSDLINNSMLPFFVIESILKDVGSEVKYAAQKQYEYDKEHYESEMDAKREMESDVE